MSELLTPAQRAIRAIGEVPLDPPMEARRVITVEGEFLIVGPLAARSSRPDQLEVTLDEEALATALCSNFDLGHHDHDAFLQRDYCAEGLDDARSVAATYRAALADTQEESHE